MPIKYLLITVLLFNIKSMAAQLKLPTEFESLLEIGQLYFNTPLENRYKRIRTANNRLLKCNFAMKKRRGDLEIRFLVRLDNGKDPRMTIPQVQAMSTLSTVATNDQAATITVHRIDSVTLYHQYGAEWGTIGYFQPKPSFSTKKHGKMLSLYSEGKAQVFIFFLFNQPTEALEQEAYTLQF